MFGIGFLAPAFLAGLLAVAIPVVLHLFRRRTDKVVDFPAVQMVPEAPVHRQERRRLRDLLLLALRAVALVLLALSFARPYVDAASSRIQTPSTIVLVDTSLSLSAPGQWDAVVRAATTAIADAPATHAVGLARFDDHAALVLAPTSDRAQVHAALATLGPGTGGTRYAAALALAAEGLGSAGGRIVVVSDLQAAGWAGEDTTGVPDVVDVVVESVPAPLSNLAVTGVRHDARRLTAVVQSYAPGPRTVVARAQVNGREYGRARVTVGALASSEVTFDADWPTTGAVEVSIDDPDGYAGDNVRYWPLEPAPPLSFIVLTAAPPESAPTGLYVQRALEAGVEGTQAVVRVTDGRRFAIDPAAPPSAIFVVGTRTLDRAGRASIASYVRNGGRLFLTLGPDVDLPTLPEVLGESLRISPDAVVATGHEAALVPSDRRHPVLRQLMGSASAIGRLPIDRYRRVLDEGGWDVLARFAGGALALAERTVDRGGVLVFASDLDNRWNRFPLEPSFAPFILEAARYLARDVRTASSYTLPDVPASLPAVAGVHLVKSAEPGRQPRTVVVNASSGESDPAAISTDAFMSSVPRSGALPAAPTGEEARTQEAAQRWWQVGLSVMLAVLLVEGVLGRATRASARADPQVT